MIFICFSHVDRYTVAQSFSYHLRNFGHDVWYDFDRLFLGDNGDILNFDEGLLKSKYVIIIVSCALFESPCAISELKIISQLYKDHKIVVLPILYNISLNEIPIEYKWIESVIYTEITDEQGTIDASTQICAKILQDIIRDNKMYSIQEIALFQRAKDEFINNLIDCYQEMDCNNINARATLLYIINSYLNVLHVVKDKYTFLNKSTNYIYRLTQLNITMNFKELSVLENSATILLNSICWN